MNTLELIKSLEACPIGDGDLRGQAFRVLPYQRRFVKGAFKSGVLRAALSTARGSGKTGLASALCLDAVRPNGVLHRDGFEVILIASSFQQSRLGFESVLVSLDLLGELGDYRVRNQQNLADLEHKQTGARLRVVGSDNKRAHGWRVNLIVADEPAQWGVAGENLFAAVKTSLGKRSGSRVLLIGTRPSSDTHFFARMLAEVDQVVYSQVHAANPSASPFAVKTWRQANPGLDFGLPNIDVLRAEARLAKRDPSELQSFKALRLNMGVDETAVQHLIGAETWRDEVETDHLPAAAGPCSWGVDLGGTAAFSAVACYWPASGRLQGFVSCGSDPPLPERAAADNVAGIYEAMQRDGDLVLLGRRIVPVDLLLKEALGRYGRPDALAADRWRSGELEDGGAGLNLPTPTWRGQGWYHGAQDVRLFRTAVLEGKVKAPTSIAIRSALSETRTVTDNSANEKLAKHAEGHKRSRGRDDLAAAIVLAVAEGSRRQAAASRPRGSFRYRGAVA